MCFTFPAKVKKLFITLSILQILIIQAFGQCNTIPSDTINKRRLCFTLTASTLSWAGAILLLNEAWYSNYPRSQFHFYNDWGEWLQMDKAGHVFSSYSLSISGIHLMKQTGMSGQKASWIGGSYGVVFLLGIEILDGFSEKWGFSVPDMSANLVGSALAISQELIVGQQPARIKYSYHESGLAKYRPDALGRNLPEKMLKDYNGQTYWLSLNMHTLSNKLEVFPGWLNIAFGYSANGMLSGNSGAPVIYERDLPYFKRYRQFYIAPDIDLSKIETSSKMINALLRSLNFIKIPSPALEYNNEEGMRIHLLFF